MYMQTTTMMGSCSGLTCISNKEGILRNRDEETSGDRKTKWDREELEQSWGSLLL